MPDKDARNRPDILFSGLGQASMLVAEPICYGLGGELWRVWVFISQPRT
jgi:hypothetical protein